MNDRNMRKVFLVEDESVIREGLRNNIPWEEYGFCFAGEAADGEMALPLIRKSRPDVLITDIKMPFMDGLSLSKMVHAEFPKMKIIIISGYDDFEYARQAIEVGVEQYLLKPITKSMLKKTLLDLKEKMDQDIEQADYQMQFQNEMHEYEKFSRRHFFEKMLDGELSVKEIYEEAAKQSVELTASCYNLLFFSMQEKKEATCELEMDAFTRKQDEVLHYFLRYPQYILFAWNVGSYGVLVMSDEKEIEMYTQKGIENIRQICAPEQNHMQWYVASGKPVERLSLLSECYQSANHNFAYRFMMPDLHILTGETLSHVINTKEDQNIAFVEPSKMDSCIIRDFLTKGSSGEIEDFVDSYLQSIKEALRSKMFRDYVVLHIRFTVAAYLETLGISQEDSLHKLLEKYQDMHVEPQEVRHYFADMLHMALDVRNQESDNQGKKLMRKVISYIDEHFDEEELSLNSVANVIDVSANYLSAVFSQTMQKTFIEYVTAKRMEKAKKLLRMTDKSSGEIALEVGYKDPHYFSFVFKKTQGCSPREYRTRKTAF